MANFAPADLLEKLSSVVPGPETRAAAETITESSDPEAALGALLPALLSGKTLATALNHLRRAGCDLEAIRIPGALRLTTWPPAMPFHWPPNPPSFVFRPGPRPPARPSAPTTASDVLNTIALHRELLAATVVAVLDLVGPDRFALLSGRAFEARFPEYRTRMEYDTDVLVPTLGDAAEIIDLACRRLGGQLVFLQLLGTKNGAPAARGALAWGKQGHLITIGFEVGRNPHSSKRLWQRAGPVSWRERSVRAISPEDLLLLAAAKHRMGRGFKRSDVADLHVLLGSGPLDMAYIAEVAAEERLQFPLLSLLRADHSTAQGSLAPIWRRHPLQGASLKSGKQRQRLLRRTFESALSATSGSPSEATVGRIGLALHPRASVCATRGQPLDTHGCRQWSAPGATDSTGEVSQVMYELPISSGPIPHRCERFAVDKSLL